MPAYDPESRTPADDRDLNADDRDLRADAHDDESTARDERALARDQRATAREVAAGTTDGGALADRVAAQRDRQGSVSDRQQAADDRVAASSDRELSATEREASSVDELTGARRREVGMFELEREVARAHRTEEPLSLAFVDVDGLKAINDTSGHAAGDDLLGVVAQAIRTHLRSYDLLVRVGGDEFLCGMSDLSAALAVERFDLVRAQLAEDHQASVTVGIAELEDGDTLSGLVSRADAAMYAQRAARLGP